MDVGWSECDGVYNVSEMEIGMNEVQPFDYDKQEFPVLSYTDVQKNILKETFPGTGEGKGMKKLNHVHAGKVQGEEFWGKFRTSRRGEGKYRKVHK